MYTNQNKSTPQKNTQHLNHVCSHYWNLANTSTNSVNFPDNPHPPQDYSENYPFFQQNKKKHTQHNTNYLSSDDDYYQPDIFAPYTKKYCTERPRQSQPSQSMKIYQQNPTDIQNPQQIHIQNPFNAQSVQPIQPQNPMSMHSYQSTQMHNEIPLPCYLQQYEITKNQLSNFSQKPNAAESLQMTMNPYLISGLSITSNKPLMVFTGTYPKYSVED